MDAISTFLKENYDFVILLVGLIGVIVALIALAVEMKKKSKNKKK